MRHHALALILLLGLALGPAPPASALELGIVAPVDAGFPLTLFTIQDGGVGDLDGTVNGEIVFDREDPGTSAIWSSPLFANVDTFKGRVTDSPTGPSFASAARLTGSPTLVPTLTLADFEMAVSSAATLALYMTGEVPVDSQIGGLVEGQLATPITSAEIGFLAYHGSPTDAIPGWDGTFEGMPIRISRGPGDDPFVSGSHGSALPPIFGIQPVTGILQLSLGAGDALGSVPEPAGSALLLAALAALGARRRGRRPGRT